MRIEFFFVLLLLGQRILSFLFSSPDMFIFGSDIAGISHFLHILHTKLTTVFNRVWVLPWWPEVSVLTKLLFEDVVFYCALGSRLLSLKF